MNCKPGDLAIRIKHGFIVTVVSSFTEPQRIRDVDGLSYLFEPPIDGVAWLCEVAGQPQPCYGEGEACGRLFVRLPVYDHALRPIRGTDGDDEMLRIAGQPRGVATPTTSRAVEFARR